MVIGGGFGFLSSVVVVVLAAPEAATLLSNATGGTVVYLKGKGVDGRCDRRQHTCTDYATR